MGRSFFPKRWGDDGTGMLRRRRKKEKDDEGTRCEVLSD